MDRQIKSVWDEWEIVELIGEGSYGQVYKAANKDNRAEMLSAVKIITVPKSQSELKVLRADGMGIEDSRTYLEGIVNSFVHEIKMMESLNGSPNIVNIYDYKVIEKSHELGYEIHIRMELLTSFDDYQAGRKFTEKEVVKIGTDICSALELCAKQYPPIIHRDIKPGNIFITKFGDFKLGDFGIARELEKSKHLYSMAGTPNYMAPEVKKGDVYGAAADVYSLGILLYKLLNNNRLPFCDLDKQMLKHSDYDEALKRRFRGETIPPPVNASKKMAQVILRACEYNPKRRFQSAAEFKAALESVTSDKKDLKPIPAPVPDESNQNDETDSVRPPAVIPEQNVISKHDDKTESVRLPVVIPEEDKIPTNENETDIVRPPEPPEIIDEPGEPNKPKPILARIIGIVASFLALALLTGMIIVLANSAKKGDDDAFDDGNFTGNELKIEDTITPPNNNTDDSSDDTSDENEPSESPTPEESTEPTISSMPEPKEPETTTTPPTVITTEPTKATQIPTTGLTGYHTQKYDNGDKYVGNFVNGVRSGQGTYTWAATGIVYTGEFVNGEPSGKGEYIYPTTEPPPTTLPPQAPTTVTPEFDEFLGATKVPIFTPRKWFDYWDNKEVLWDENKKLTLTLPEFPGVTFIYTHEYVFDGQGGRWMRDKVTANDKNLFDMNSDPSEMWFTSIDSIFLADLTNDGKPELCVTVYNAYTGLLFLNVIVHDYVTDITYSSLGFGGEYFLAIDGEGKLLLIENVGDFMNYLQDPLNYSPQIKTELQIVNGEIRKP